MGEESNSLENKQLVIFGNGDGDRVNDTMHTYVSTLTIHKLPIIAPYSPLTAHMTLSINENSRILKSLLRSHLRNQQTRTLDN